jgi:hypothetical protein
MLSEDRRVTPELLARPHVEALVLNGVAQKRRYDILRTEAVK